MEKANAKLALFDSAMKLFHRHGYEKVTIQQICKEAGVTRNAFYYYFESKESLLSSYFENVPSFTEKLVAELMSLPNDWEKVWRIFEAHLQLIENEGISICRAFLRINMDGCGDLLMKYSLSEKICIPLIKNCQDAGLIANMTEPSKLNYIATRMLSGILLVWCCKNGSFPLLPDCKAAFDSLMLPRA